MSDEHEANLQRLAELLQTSPIADDDPLRKLAEALVPDESYSHKQAERELPDYVSDELLGRPVARLYPALHRHLLQCERCAEMHADMLAAFDETPEAIAIPEPKLSFLPPINWRREMVDTTRAIITQLWPKLREPLDQIAELFFAQIDRGGGGRLSQGGVFVPAFAFGGGDAPVSLQVLAAAYMAEQTLVTRYGSLERAAGNLASAKQAVTGIVTEAAREAGIAKQDRQRFVEAYLALLPGQGIGNLPPP